MAADFVVDAELVVRTRAAQAGMQALSDRLGRVAGALRGAQSSGMGFVSSMLVTNAITAGMGMLGGAVRSVTSGVLDLTTQMQGAQIGIATMVAGFREISFQEAQGEAAGLYRQIQDIALESTATSSQLQDAFQTMYAGMAAAGMDSAQQMRMLSGTATAAAAYMGNDLGQTSRDMSMILSGLAGNQVKLWRPLQHLVGMTAEEWNAMAKSDPSRAAAEIQRVLGSDAMTEAGRAYGRSLAGALSSAEDFAEHFKRSAFTPFANAFGAQLNRMNDWLKAHRQVLDAFFTHVGQGAAALFTRWANSIAERLSYVSTHWNEIAERIAVLYARASALVPHVLAAAKAWMVVRTGMMGAAVAMQAASKAAAMSATVAEGAGFFREGGRFLGAGLAGAGGAAAGGGGAAAAGAGATAGGVGLLANIQTIFAALQPVLAPFAAVLTVIAGVVTFLVNGWDQLLGVLATIAPVVQSTFMDFMTFGEGLWSVLGPILEMIGGLVTSLGAILGGAFLIALRAVAWLFGRLGEALKWVGRQLASVAHVVIDAFWGIISFIADAVAELGALMDVAIDVSSLRNARRNLNNMLNQAGGQGAQAPATPAPSQTPTRNVTNINGARITVNQEFREADPDRVAVRMIEDIARFAEQRIQSGYAPAFTR